MVALQDKGVFIALSFGIKETFTSIDRFEWQACDDLRKMRDEGIYKEGGYSSFQEYCEAELCEWGGYRRVCQLLSAKDVIDKFKGTEFEGLITKERQARPLAKLLKFPEKMREVAAIATQNNDKPTSVDFAKAVLQVVPKKPGKPKPSLSQNEAEVKEPRFFRGVKVKVSSQSHPKYGEEGEISGDPPNLQQQFVDFEDGRAMMFNRDLSIVDAPIERKLPPEYQEAIAQLEQQHKEEIARLENELRVGLVTEAEGRAIHSVQEQLEVATAIASQAKEENIRLQQRLEELESLRQLADQNQLLQQENEELKNQLQQKPMERWDTSSAVVERLNKNVQAAINNTIDLRSLAEEPPKEDAQECLRLMGMALGNLARALNDNSAMAAAAMILKCEPNPGAIAFSIERSHLSDQAVIDIRKELAKPGCEWEQLHKVASEYEEIKQEYWNKLTLVEKKVINELKKAFDSKESEFPELSPIQVGASVSHSDQYSALYTKNGRVHKELNDEEVSVVWDDDAEQRPKRYFKTDLRKLLPDGLNQCLCHLQYPKNS